MSARSGRGKTYFQPSHVAVLHDTSHACRDLLGHTRGTEIEKHAGGATPLSSGLGNALPKVVRREHKSPNIRAMQHTCVTTLASGQLGGASTTGIVFHRFIQ